MAFLDNSGDIILDAVLTDTGRFRLAKGDGSFKIVKFALSDDEINYGLYDKNNLSGSVNRRDQALIRFGLIKELIMLHFLGTQPLIKT